MFPDAVRPAPCLSPLAQDVCLESMDPSGTFPWVVLATRVVLLTKDDLFLAAWVPGLASNGLLLASRALSRLAHIAGLASFVRLHETELLPRCIDDLSDGPISAAAGVEGLLRPAARTMTDEADAIVVESGINGLVAAAELAQAGWSVILLERNAEIGGVIATEERTLPGYSHDTSRPGTRSSSRAPRTPLSASRDFRGHEVDHLYARPRGRCVLRGPYLPGAPRHTGDSGRALRPPPPAARGSKICTAGTCRAPTCAPACGASVALGRLELPAGRASRHRCYSRPSPRSLRVSSSPTRRLPPCAPSA